MTLKGTPDPGGDFASDDHRRVQATVPNPDDKPLSVEDIYARTAADNSLFLTIEELVDVLRDLEADGLSEGGDQGWRNTEKGFELLIGPVGDSAEQTDEEFLARERESIKARIEVKKQGLDELKESIRRDEKIAKELS